MNAKIDFWYSIGSTYTSLSVMRIDDIAQKNDVQIVWRPFNVLTVMSEVGNRGPFRGKPVKLAYMWRDIERRAGRYGLEVKVPAPYPLPELERANLIAALAQMEGWCEAYTLCTYRRWFQDGLEPGSDKHIDTVLPEIGQEPSRVVEQAGSDKTRETLLAATEQALKLGIFGSPTFVFDGELFWGDDRLEDAIDWAKHGTLART